MTDRNTKINDLLIKAEAEKLGFHAVGNGLEWSFYEKGPFGGRSSRMLLSIRTKPSLYASGYGRPRSATHLCEFIQSVTGASFQLKWESDNPVFDYFIGF